MNAVLYRPPDFIRIVDYRVNLLAARSNNVHVAKDCWIGPGVVISANTEAGQMFPAAKAAASRVDAHRFFKLKG